MTLVTGGSGFIGSHLLEKMCAAGEPVRCLVRRRALPRAVADGVETVSGDLASGQGLEQALDGVGTVIHLAGVTKALDAGEYIAGNARATEMLLAALGSRPVRFLHVSSLAAAGPNPDGTPLDEDAEPRPVTTYGRSKLQAERAVRRMRPDAVIVRPPVVYGPRDTDVFQLLKSISKGLAVEMGGGERWFSAIFVRDLVEGLLAAARSTRAAGRTYFLAHATPLTWGDLRAVASQVMGRTPRVVRIPVAGARAAGYCAEVWSRLTGTPGIVSREKVVEAECRWWTCDTRRASEELGFTAPTTLAAGLAETLGWYKEAGWLKY
jgi:nucleoside-diphosphate-sugar epimerase